MRPASQSGLFIPSDTAMNSDSVDDLELSFCILEHKTKNPIPSVTHMAVVDLIFCRLAKGASIDTTTLGGIMERRIRFLLLCDDASPSTSLDVPLSRKIAVYFRNS
jgi:hypothetical protein